MNIDWDLCFICQQQGKDKLRSTVQGIKSLATNLYGFWQLEPGILEFLRTNVISLVQNEAELETYLTSKNAKYHKVCSNRYDSQKLQRYKESLNETPGSSSSGSRSSRKKSRSTLFCAICNEEDTMDNLHAAGSYHAKRKVVNSEHNKMFTEKWKAMALITNNAGLLALLSTGDLNANEIFYHGSCYKTMQYESEKFQRDSSSSDINTEWIKAEAVDRVVSYIIEHEETNPGSVYVVKEMNQMYIDYLSEQGISEQPNTTRFTAKVLNALPNLSSKIINKKSVLLFDDTISALVQDYIGSPDDFFIALRKLVLPIREEIFKLENNFNNDLNLNDQSKTIPKRLLCLTNALIDGFHRDKVVVSQESLTVAQIVVSNATKRTKRKAENTLVRRHSKNQETPLLIYNTLKIYSTCRSRNIIDHLFSIGICVSYDRILELTQNVYENLRESYQNYNCFFPKILKKGLFTVMMKDNIDMNARSTFVKSHYHGTSLSVVQFPTIENPGTNFENNIQTVNNKANSKKLAPLPAEYINTKKLFHMSENFDKRLWAPLCRINFEGTLDCSNYKIAFKEELTWLRSIQCFFNLNVDTDFPAWSRYHSSFNRGPSQLVGINTIMPLIPDKVNTLQMQGHCMTLNINSTKTFNSNQTPIDVSDQPVYAITKELQYRYPHLFEKYFPLMGGLHIEQSLLVMHGQLIEGSGLIELLNFHNFSTIGLSAIVDANHIKRARYAVQVTVSALYLKLKEASLKDKSNLDPYDWLEEKSKSNKMCYIWKNILDFELQILIFVRSQREGNFLLYREILRTLIGWYFSFGHFHYARWLSVHLFDLITLETVHKDVFDNFLLGHFCFKKTDKLFSRMALDQLHEQNNRTIKSSVASSFANRADDSALIRWETCGAELSRIINEFEDEFKPELKCGSNHHEDSKSFSSKFFSDIKTLSEALPVNPFYVENELIKINDPSIVLTDETFVNMSEMKTNGEKQFNSFIQERLVYQKVSLCTPIDTNKFDLWQTKQNQLEKHHVISSLTIKKICSAIEFRQDLATIVFDFELYNVPYSLSSNLSTLYHGTKSDIINRLPQATIVPDQQTEVKSAIILEMSPIIRAKCLSLPDNISCFHDVAVVLYYEVLKQGLGFDRIDAVFDRYFDKSLKEATRTKRGSGTRLKINEECSIPKNFESFLHVSQNKNEFNEYLSKKFIDMHSNNQILVCTYRETILSSHPEIITSNTNIDINKCQSEEADQRLVRHTLHCLSTPFLFKRIIINTIDTDVLILLIANLSPYIRDDLGGISVYVKMVRSGVFYDLRAMILAIDNSICEALPFFYAFSGCDTVSSIFSKGKCKVWDIWMEDRNQIEEVFIRLGLRPSEITNSDMDIIEKFVTKLYTKKDISLTELRKEMFRCMKDNDLRRLPPSRVALVEHVKRACYQAGFIWQETRYDIDLPDPENWGWVMIDNTYKPRWQQQDCPVKVSKLIDTCSCQKRSCKNCKCAKEKVVCISMCGCHRTCTKN